MEEEDRIMTLDEYCNEINELEMQAATEYPLKFDQCSYYQGYVRQPIFTCLSCTEKPNAVCYSCSLACHSSCNLIELSIRRHFRCDCGNDLFSGGGSKCNLTLVKDPLNSENNYSSAAHNFKGNFCSCNEPYFAEEEQSDMLQCLICQDWFHEHCITKNKEIKIPSADLFDEIICQGCVEKYPFLSALLLNNNQSGIFSLSKPLLVDIESLNNTVEPICFAKYNTAKEGQLDWTFMPKGWRSILCKCFDCECLLKEKNISFILEEEPIYEPEPDPEALSPTFDIAMKALDTVQEKELVHAGIKAFDNLKIKLMDYLKPISAAGKVITKEDIENFFIQQHIQPRH